MFQKETQTSEGFAYQAFGGNEMKEMKIEYLKLSDLKPYENNPRHNDEAVDYVANSIREFGFKVPIIIDQNNVIVTGHTRLKASEKLGLTEVPCIRAKDLTEEQVKAFRIADNKVGEIAKWDMDKLQIELEDIELDMSDFGFDDLGEEEIIEEEDDGGDGINGDEKFSVEITFQSHDDWNAKENELWDIVRSVGAEMIVNFKRDEV